MLAVELSGVTKAFGSVVAVDDLSLAVPAGATPGVLEQSVQNDTDCLAKLAPRHAGQAHRGGQAVELPATLLV